MPLVLEMSFITATLGTNVVQGIIKVAEVTAVPMVIFVTLVAIKISHMATVV